MTRETRIGLVVGLLFIVMFALVLSELTDAGAPAPTTGAGSAMHTDEESPVIEVIDGFTSRPVPPADDAAPDVAADDSPPSPTPLAKGPEDDSVYPSLSAVEGPGRPGPADAVPVEPGPAPGAERRETVPPGPPPREDARPRMIDPPRAAETPRRVLPARDSQPRAKTYRVQPGDTLTEIARKTLSDASPSAIRRILDANRGRIDDPDFIPVGLELVIPPASASAGPPVRSAYYRRALEDLSREFQRRAALRDRDRPVDAVPTPPAQPRRVYKVRRGDNLTKIAREMLRDGSRSAVRRILDANPGKIKNPNVLPIGVELVIPS